jgi:hypothetical protein
MSPEATTAAPRDAAPDLIAALQIIVSHIDLGAPSLILIREVATAAIAKARARPQQRSSIEAGDLVIMVHHYDPYHPGQDPNVGKVGTVTRVVDGAWGERAEFETSDGRTIYAGTHELRHVGSA